jgi:lipopolysaccharide assembly outer membrane protein LptD (OstA)
VSPYVGYTFGTGGLIKADLGYVAHIYTNLRNYREPKGVDVARNTNEIYGGVRFDVLCDPSVYAFYDIEREEFAFVAAGAYSWDLSALGLTNISLEAKATVGYDYSKRPFGGKFLGVEPYMDDSKDYFYYCLEGIAAYRYNDNVTFKGRVSYSGNSATDESWTNALFGGRHKNLIWLGGAVEIGF